jgi:hypothetical protein
VSARCWLGWCAIAASLACCAPTNSTVMPQPDAAHGASDASDAGSVTEPSVELATGGPGEFSTVTDGQQVLLQRGCQGSQHVFFSLRARGIPFEQAPWITLSVLREEDQRAVSSRYELRLPLTARSDGSGEITGLTPVIEEPRAVIGRAVVMVAVVEDASRTVRAEARRRVTVAWGPDSCRPHG